jgi:hypothetical protein
VTVDVTLSALIEGDSLVVGGSNGILVILLSESEVGAVLSSAWYNVKFETLVSSCSIHVLIADLAVSEISIPGN